MAYSFLVFDFGANEDAAQQARHRIEGWRQGFRLDKKLQLKFEREESEGVQDAPAPALKDSKKPDAKARPASKTKARSAKADDSQTGSTATATSDIHLIVRLDFSDHEKLSHQRWLERIPAEDPFKQAKPKVVRSSDPEFAKMEELFDSLE